MASRRRSESRFIACRKVGLGRGPCAPAAQPRLRSCVGMFMSRALLAVLAVLAALLALGPAGSYWSEHPLLPSHPIRYWQIWNEPDRPYRWYAPKGSAYAWPGGYVSLVAEARRAPRGLDPGGKIGAAGPPHNPWE